MPGLFEGLNFSERPIMRGDFIDSGDGFEVVWSGGKAPRVSVYPSDKEKAKCLSDFLKEIRDNVRRRSKETNADISPGQIYLRVSSQSMKLFREPTETSSSLDDCIEKIAAALDLPNPLNEAGKASAPGM